MNQSAQHSAVAVRITHRANAIQAHLRDELLVGALGALDRCLVGGLQQLVIVIPPIELRLGLVG